MPMRFRYQVAGLQAIIELYEVNWTETLKDLRTDKQNQGWLLQWILYIADMFIADLYIADTYFKNKFDGHFI